MNTQLADSQETRSRSRLGDRTNVLFWAILYGLAVMVAGDTVLRQAAADQGPDTPFASPETLLTFLRVAAFFWAVLFSALQAMIYNYLFAATTRHPKPTLLHGWTWVLWSQIPFMVFVAVSQLIGDADGVDVVRQPWVRVGLGLVSVVVYALFAIRARRPPLARTAAFCVLGFTINTALLLLTAGVG